MKKVEKFRNWLARRVAVPFSWLPVMIGGMFKNIWNYYFKGIKSPRMFRGYWAFYFAKKYAVKRCKNWATAWDQLGRQQAVLPLDESLLVCSKLELKAFQKKGIVKLGRHYARFYKKTEKYFETPKFM